MSTDARSDVPCWVHVISEENVATQERVCLGRTKPGEAVIGIDSSGSTDTEIEPINEKVLDIETSVFEEIVQGPAAWGDWAFEARHWSGVQEFKSKVTANYGTEPECFVACPEIRSALESASVLFFSTDGQCDPSNLAAQQEQYYNHLSAVVVLLVSERTSSPCRQNVSVFAPFQSQHLLVLHAHAKPSTQDDAVKVLYANGNFLTALAAQGVPLPPVLTEQLNWTDLPSISVAQARALEVPMRTPLPQGFREIIDPETHGLFGRPIAYSFRKLHERVSAISDQPLTEMEFNILRTIFPIMLRQAKVEKDMLGTLETLMKAIEKQAVKSIQDTLSALPAPCRDAVNALTQRITSIVARGQQQGAATDAPHTIRPDATAAAAAASATSSDVVSPAELAALRKQLTELRIAERDERTRLHGPATEFLNQVRSFTQGCLQDIAEVRAGGCSYDAGSFFGQTSNRARKARRVATDENQELIWCEDGALRVMCALCGSESGVGCLWIRKNLSTDEQVDLTSDSVLNFPLAQGRKGLALGLVVSDGPQMVCMECARGRTRTPFREVDNVVAVPLMNLQHSEENRENLASLLALHWTGGALLSQTTHLLLATLCEAVRSGAWELDASVFRFLAQGLVCYSCTDNMSEYGDAGTLAHACVHILTLTSADTTFQHGALYAQPHAAICTIVFLNETLDLGGAAATGVPHKSRILRLAHVYATVQAWLRLMHPTATEGQQKHLAKLRARVLQALYDCGSGTAKNGSGRVINEAECTALLAMLHKHAPEMLGVTVVPFHVTIVLAALLTLRGHGSFSGVMSWLRDNKHFGVFVTDLVAQMELLDAPGREAEFVRTLNTLLFDERHVLGDECTVPAMVSPYGASCLGFQVEGGTWEPFVHTGSYADLDALVEVARARRRELFQSRYHTVLLAPCAVSSNYSSVIVLMRYYEEEYVAQDRAMPAFPSRTDLVAIVSRLMRDGRGGLHHPILLQAVALHMASHIVACRSWPEPRRAGVRWTFRDRVEMELAVYCGKELVAGGAPLVLTEEHMGKLFRARSSQFTRADFDQHFGALVQWDALVAPLTAEELKDTFVMQHFQKFNQ